MEKIDYSIQYIRCGEYYLVKLDPVDLVRWQNKEGFIQDLMPYLSDSDRELLISGTCSKCWNKLYKEED